MIDLKKIQTISPTHSIIKYQQPLPNYPVEKNKWYDRYGIYYELNNDTLKIIDNVKVSNNKRDDYYPGEDSFDWWLLWLDDKDFNCVVNKLIPKVKNRSIYIRNIVNTFFKKYPFLAYASDYEKVNFVFEWLRKNTAYDSSATNKDGTLKNGANYSQDPVYTYINKKGVCCGRAQLMKILLNNHLMKVNCFLIDGICCQLQHQWNEVYLNNGQVLYYDLSFGRKNIEKIENYSDYKNITHQDALNWDFNINNDKAKLKIKRDEHEQ